MKKIISAMLVAAVILSFASCGNTRTEETTTAPKGTEPAETTTAGSTAGETTASETTTASSETEESTENVENPPAVEITEVADLERIAVGEYVTLVYNGASADVKVDVQKGIGSRENVTLTATMKNDYLFDGWSEGDAIVNGKTATETSLTCTFTAAENIVIYLNSSITLRYHENGGKVTKEGFDGTDTYSVVFYQNPNTLPEQGYFTREGYTLTGYNTKSDGTGEAISIGSKVTATGEGVIDVYCIWEENTPISDFTYTKTRGVTITSYTGTAENVIIPEEIDGTPVVRIGANAFVDNTTMRRIVISKNVELVEKGAFKNCSALETVVLYDCSFGSNGIADNSFSACPNLKNIRVNTCFEIYNNWTAMTAGKIDRLIWAKDKKKLVIVGGSGSLFGYDCSILEEALGGEYEIVNFGENANVTSLAYFDILADVVNEGDIVLWCPEPGHYTLGRFDMGRQFFYFRQSNFDFLKYIDYTLYSDLLSNFSAYCNLIKSATFKDHDVLTNSMNKYGDVISDRTWQGKTTKYSFNYRSEADYILADVVEEIKAKGAKCFFSFAAMQASGLNGVSDATVAAYEAMIEDLGFTSISDVKNCLYADDAFYDSEWHLTDDGARERTEHVAKDIIAALAE